MEIPCVSIFSIWSDANEYDKFLRDKRLTIALKGEIDHHSAKDTMRIIGNKIDIYLPMVCVLDFRDVTFMDSERHRDCHSRHPGACAELRAWCGWKNAPPQPMKVLKASGMERIVVIEERSMAHEV